VDSINLHDFFTYAGVFVGGIVLALAGYRKKPKPSEPETVVTGIGVELGNRHQTDQLIAIGLRIAVSLEMLADKKQAGMEAKIDRILEDLEERERGR
jgi:glutamate dehydrogenase/leucine dehydrogenase